MAGLITFLAFLIVFGIIVFVHEFGHFAAAKLSGVGVEEFAIGFGPIIFTKEYKGTKYSVRALPLGGYVQTKGERLRESDDPEAYVNAPLRSKLFILFAGVFMNFVLAVILGAVYLGAVNYQVIIQNLVDYSFVGPEVNVIPESLQVLSVQEEGPAGGLIFAGDLLIEINGETVENRQQVLDILDQNQGQTIPLMLINVDDFTRYEVQVALNTKVNEDDPILGVGFPGAISGNPQDEILGSFYVLNYPQNIFSGFTYAVDVFGYQIAALGSSIGDAVQQSDATVVTDQLSSPAGILDIVGKIISAERLKELLNLTVVLNLALAFFNLLPLPILDGGQAVIEVVQSVRGKLFSERTMSIMIYTSFGLMLLLFVLIFFKDLTQLGFFESISNFARSALGR